MIADAEGILQSSELGCSRFLTSDLECMLSKVVTQARGTKCYALMQAGILAAGLKVEHRMCCDQT